MLYTRYGGAVQEVLLLEYEDFILQINYAMEEKREDDVRLRWINGYQNISLDEFKRSINYRKLSESNIDHEDIENVLDELLGNFG